MSAITLLLRVTRNCMKNTFDIDLRPSLERQKYNQEERRRRQSIAKSGYPNIIHVPSLLSYRRWFPLPTYTRLFHHHHIRQNDCFRTNVFSLKNKSFPSLRVITESESQLPTAHRPPDFPANCNANMLFAKPAASTPSSKSSKKHSATSRLSSCVGLTPPTCATRC